MASVKIVKPVTSSNELNMNNSVELAISDSREIPKRSDSAYESNCSSECRNSPELENSVFETHKQVENDTQKIEYLEKSDSILRNLFRAVKDENDLLKQKIDTAENKFEALQSSCEVLNSKKDSLKSLNVILQEKCSMLENQALMLQKDIDRLTNLNVVLEKSTDVQEKLINSMKMTMQL